jgi:hypothetical protein
MRSLTNMAPSAISRIAARATIISHWSSSERPRSHRTAAALTGSSIVITPAMRAVGVKETLSANNTGR